MEITSPGAKAVRLQGLSAVSYSSRRFCLMCQTSLGECFSRAVRWQQSPKEGSTVIKIRAVGDEQRTLYSHATSSTVRCALVLCEKSPALSFSSLQVVSSQARCSLQEGALLLALVKARNLPSSWNFILELIPIFFPATGKSF